MVRLQMPGLRIATGENCLALATYETIEGPQLLAARLACRPLNSTAIIVLLLLTSIV